MLLRQSAFFKIYVFKKEVIKSGGDYSIEKREKRGDKRN